MTLELEVFHIILTGAWLGAGGRWEEKTWEAGRKQQTERCKLKQNIYGGVITHTPLASAANFSNFGVKHWM